MARWFFRTTLAVASLLALVWLVGWLGARRYAESLVAGVAPQAQLTYAGISVLPPAHVGLRDVAFAIADRPDLQVTARRVRLSSSDPVWFARWLFGQAPELPERLTVHLEGVQASPALLAGWRDRLGLAGLTLPFEGVGCRADDRLTDSDYRILGWDQPRFDIELQLRPERAARRLAASLRLDRQPAGVMALEAEFADVPDRGLQLAADLGGARLDRLQLRLEELGSLAARNRYCAEQSAAPVALFVEQHLERLHERLRALGLVPDEPIWSGYRQWLDAGGEWMLTARPAPGIPFAEYGNFAPEDRLRLLGLNARLGEGEAVAVDATAARRREGDFQPLPPDEVWLPDEEPERADADDWSTADQQPAIDADALVDTQAAGAAPATEAPTAAAPMAAPDRLVADPATASTPAQPSAAPAPGTLRPVAIDYAELGEHAGRHVRIRTVSGNRYRGRVLGSTADALELEIARYGGGARLPIPRDQIIGIEVLLATDGG